MFVAEKNVTVINFLFHIFVSLSFAFRYPQKNTNYTIIFEILTKFFLKSIISLAPINGHWGRWGSWGECSVTCGKGVHSRMRKCDDPAPKNGGKQCKGKSDEKKNCLEMQCGAGE